MREVQDQGYRIRLDVSRQVLRLSIPEDDATSADAPLEKTLGSALRRGFVPGSALVQKAKQFDDGLYAAVELAAQAGAGSFAGKTALLRGLVRELTKAQASGEALALLVAAGRLGGLDLPASPPLEPAVAACTSGFMGNEMKSKPLGFYTWSPELKAIFRQDRLLQSPLQGTHARAIGDILRGDAGLAATYRAYLALVAGLTNPIAGGDVLTGTATRSPAPTAPRLIPTEAHLLPASVSHEGDLVMKLFGGRDIPEGFSLMDEMIRRIRSGDLPLTPTARSGWYDYQTWSHEPLVIPEKMPEAAHLALSETYRKALLDMFKGAQALARETHVKQLRMPMPGAALGGPRKQPVCLRVSPDLSVEPLPTYYLRRALGYGHVRSTLGRAFGDGALAGLKRLGPEGPATIDLDAELHATESLFWGAYHTACRQIGLAPDASLPVTAQADEHVARFASWAGALSGDGDLGRDARMMVPVFFDIGRQETKVWAFLGWVTETLVVAFERPPRAEVFDKGGREVKSSPDLQVVFPSERHTVAYPVMAEVYVTKLLDREEFRRHCDIHETKAAILANLV